MNRARVAAWGLALYAIGWLCLALCLGWSGIILTNAGMLALIGSAIYDELCPRSFIPLPRKRKR